MKQAPISTMDLGSIKINDNGTVINTISEYTGKEQKANSGEPTGLERYFDSDKDYYRYIEGDFTKSLEKADYYVENQPNYNLVGFNCAWLSLELLQASYDESSEMYRQLDDLLWNGFGNRRTIIPNNVDKKVEKLPGSQCE